MHTNCHRGSCLTVCYFSCRVFGPVYLCAAMLQRAYQHISESPLMQAPMVKTPSTLFRTFLRCFSLASCWVGLSACLRLNALHTYSIGDESTGLQSSSELLQCTQLSAGFLPFSTAFQMSADGELACTFSSSLSPLWLLQSSYGICTLLGPHTPREAFSPTSAAESLFRCESLFSTPTTTSYYKDLLLLLLGLLLLYLLLICLLLLTKVCCCYLVYLSCMHHCGCVCYGIFADMCTLFLQVLPDLWIGHSALQRIQHHPHPPLLPWLEHSPLC